MQETLQHQQAGLVQSHMGSLLLSPGSRCTHTPVCALQEWSLCLFQSHQGPTVKSLQPSISDYGNSSSHRQIPRLGSPTWGPEPSLQLVDFCGIIALQFVSQPPSGYGTQFYCDCAPPTLPLWPLLCLWMLHFLFCELRCLPANCPAVSFDSDALARGSPTLIRVLIINGC